MKKRTRSLPDTNTIVRYLVNDDLALYAKAKEFFDRVRDGTARAVILESVIAECVYVLTKMYRVPRDRAAGSLIDILRVDSVLKRTHFPPENGPTPGPLKGITPGLPFQSLS